MQILRSGVCLAVMALLAGAMVSVPAGSRAVADEVCSDEWAPVCAVFPDGFRRTFSSECWAKLNNARWLHDGVCLGAWCPDTDEPVCAIDPVSGHHATYGNLCWAEVADASLVHPGACWRHHWHEPAVRTRG